MSSSRIINRLTLILLLAVGLLGFVVFRLWQDLQMGQHAPQSAIATEPGQPASKRGSYQQRLISFTPPSLDVFNEILERPLFTNGRLPPEEPVQTFDNQPKVQLKLRLEGVAVVGGKRFALLRDLTNNELLRLQQGMQHQGWRINEVKPESAEFTRGKETTELQLELDTEKRTKLPPQLKRPARPAGVRKRSTR